MGRGRRFGQWQQPDRRFPFRAGATGRQWRRSASQVARKFVGSFGQKVDGKGRVSIPAVSAVSSKPATPLDRRPAPRRRHRLRRGRPAYLEGYHGRGHRRDARQDRPRWRAARQARGAWSDLYLFLRPANSRCDDDGRHRSGARSCATRSGWAAKSLFVAKGDTFRDLGARDLSQAPQAKPQTAISLRSLRRRLRPACPSGGRAERD